MREPVRDVAVEHDQQHEPEPLPAPAVSLMPGRKLSELDAQFIHDIARCIRAGTRPLTAALWLGCTRKQWRVWKQRAGEPYDQLRAAVRAATAHIEMRLQADLAKRSPGAALKGLRKIRDDDEPEPSRRYDKSGVNTIKRALPHLLERVNDSAIPDAHLSPVEAVAREWKENVVRDCGGRDNLTTTRMALITSATGSWIMLSTIDSYILELAQAEGLTSRKHRRAWPIVEQRARIADAFSRQLAMIGLERQSAPPQDLSTYIQQKYGGQNGDATTPTDATKET